MSEFIAEAQVLISPNTAAFAATLRKQVEAAVAAAGPVAVPIVAAPVASAGAGAAAASTAAFTAAQEDAAVAALGLSRVTGLEAQALDLAAKAQLDMAAAAQVAGAAAEEEAIQIRTLAVAQDLAVAAFKKSEAVSLAAVGATSELAAARATLRAATSAVVANEVAFDAALATNVEVMKADAAAALLDARAIEVSAEAAFASARAHRVDAAATAESAAAHSQAARGIAAETLSLAGLRGATLAASAPFLAGATAAIVFAKSIKAASDETEQINKTIEIFGSSAQAIEDFSKTTATSLGISSDAALEAAGIFGNLFRSIKISQPVAADMSEQLVRLAADLASFNNASPERTLEALRAGLVGQARPLRVFGVFLSQARAQQQALVTTGKENVKQLTNQELVQARFNIILQDTTIAQGDFARTSDRLANQSRILQAQLADIAVTIGNQLIPVVLLAVQDVNLLVEAFRKLGGLKIKIPGTESGGSLDSLKGKVESIFGKRFSKDLALNILFPGVGTTINNLELTKVALKALGISSEGADQNVTHLGQSLERASEHGRGAANGIGVAVDQINHLLLASQHASAALEILNLKIETGLAPGGRPGQEANLRQQIEEDKKAIAAADTGSRELRQALEALRTDQQALAALQQQDTQDSKDRANKIKAAAEAQKKAASDAARAQADATQAFIEIFAPKQQRLQNRLSTAQQFGTAKQQIAINKRIVAEDTAEIHAIQARIRHLKLHGAALKLARDTIKALQQDIFNTRNDIIKLRADQKQAALDRQQAALDARQQHLEAILSIAETTDKTSDDKKALNALIRFDEARIAALKKIQHKTQEEKAQLDAYRVDLAQRRKALKDLEKEQKDTNKAAQSLFFTFLQTQQGFAANLLGNLIPGFATSGLVGGSSQTAGGGGGGGGSSQSGTVIGNVSDMFPILPSEHGRGIGSATATAAAVATSRDRGVRPVQVDTTNHLLRQILHALTGRHASRPPEIVHNGRVGNAAFDSFEH